MNEGPYDKFKREQEESERNMVIMRNELARIERQKKEDAEVIAAQQHIELLESMKKNSGIHISSGRDTHILESNLAGTSQKNEQSKKDTGDHWYKKPVGIVVLAVTGGVILAIITALLRHFYLHWFS